MKRRRCRRRRRPAPRSRRRFRVASRRRCHPRAFIIIPPKLTQAKKRFMRSSREVITEIFCHYRVAPRRKHKELTNHNDDNAESERVVQQNSRDASPTTKSAPAIARNHSLWCVRLNSPLASFECESNAGNLARLRLALHQSQPRLSSVTSTRGFAHAHAHI